MIRASLQGDPTVYVGSSIPEVLARMREASRYPERDLQAWMEAYAIRLCRWDGGTPIPTGSPEVFWHALVARGHLTTLPTPDP